MHRARKAIEIAADGATVVLAVVAIALFWATTRANTGSQAGAGQDRLINDWQQYADAEHRLGPRDAPVAIIEFGDYECPFCKDFQPVLKSVLESYPRQVSVTYRHFPLSQHAYAYEAARFAECAADQDVFADAHSFLYATADLSALDAMTVATFLNVPDRDTFMRCATDTARVAQIESDVELARRLGIRGTPSVIVNGLLLSSTPDSVDLRDLVEHTLKLIQD